MDVLRHRPLFLWCIAFTAASAGGFLLFASGTVSGLPSTVLLWIALSSLLAAGVGAGIALTLTHRRRGAATIALAVIVSALGLWQSYATFAGAQTRRLSSLEEQTVTATGVITERRGGTSQITNFSLELSYVDGISTDGLAVLTCYYNADLRVGDVVEVCATAKSLTESVGDGYSAAALLGDGYVLALQTFHESDVTVTDTASNHLTVRLGEVRRTLVNRLHLVVDKRVSGLPAAVLLGDRSAISDTVQRDFARAGVSHLLAISGLHMTLLFGLLYVILRFCRVPRKLRAILLGVAALGYLILLGFPSSATRAVIMLGFVYLSTVLSLRADPLTSLGVAGVLILAVTPNSAADAGFWMSYLAVLLLLSIMPWVNRAMAGKQSTSAAHPLGARARNLLLRVLIGVAVGVVAMSATLTVVTAVIGETSLLSPISTLLMTPLCGAILILSLAALPLAGTPAGGVIGGLIERICTLMQDLAATLSEPRWVVISLRHPAVLPLAVAMLIALLLLIFVRLPERRRWVIALPILVGWMAILGVVSLSDRLMGEDLKVSFLQPSSQADMLVLVEGRDALICDFSNGSLTSLSAAANEASRRGATEIAALMLTHYHRTTGGALHSLLARETVRALWVPYPESESDYYVLLDCVEKAEAAGVSVVVYEKGTHLRVFGDRELTLQTAALARSTQPVLLLTLDTDPRPDYGGEVVYCGSAVFESDLSHEAACAVSSADVVIFGNHGPLVKQPFGEDLSFAERAEIVISEKGDVAAYFRADTLPDTADLWLGQRCLALSFP